MTKLHLGQEYDTDENGDTIRYQVRSAKPKFDSTISLGTVLLIMSILGSMYTLNNNVVARLTQIEQKVDMMWQMYKLAPR